MTRRTERRALLEKDLILDHRKKITIFRFSPLKPAAADNGDSKSHGYLVGVEDATLVVLLDTESDTTTSPSTPTAKKPRANMTVRSY